MITNFKTIAMQRLADAMPHYQYFTSGATSIEKWPDLSKKFARLYDTEDSPSTKSRAKVRGFAVTKLIAWLPSEDRPTVHWWLLITKGKGSVWRLEYGIRDAHQERIEIGGGYQLVHDSRSWTWKYREEHVLGLKESMRRAIVTRRDGDLNKLIADLYRTVGFRLARKQVGQIMGEGRQKWKLHRRGEPFPATPARLNYVRRLANG